MRLVTVAGIMNVQAGIPISLSCFRVVASAIAILAIIGCSNRNQNPSDVRARLATLRTPELTSESKEVLAALRSLNPSPIVQLTPGEARRQPTFRDAVILALSKRGRSTQPLEIGSVRPLSIPDAGRTIPARVYTPQGSGPFPVLVYYHGGGWVLGNLDTYDSSCRALAKASKRIVVSVDYRLAPEHKFPAAVDDAYAAYAWVLQNASTFNGDPKRIAVGGESAGGNLAAVTSIVARNRSELIPEHQLLVYPVTDLEFDSASYRVNAHAAPLNAELMEWFRSHYLVSPADGDSPLAAPIRNGDMRKLPPATIITAEVDPLQSDGIDYAERLKQAGVTVRFRNYEGVPHEFFGAGAIIPEAADAVEFAADGLK